MDRSMETKITEADRAKNYLGDSFDSIFSVLNKKEKEIIKKRFGFDGEEKKTLQSVGQEIRLTRERVRQIQKMALKKIKDSKIPKIEETDKEIRDIIIKNGWVIEESKLRKLFRKKAEGAQSSDALLEMVLEISSGFEPIKRSRELEKAWVARPKTRQFILSVIDVVKSILENAGKAIKHPSLTEAVKNEIEEIDENIISAALSITKKIMKTEDDRWGFDHWSAINPQNTRDRAYLIIKQGKRPIHYRKIAEMINGAKFSPKPVTVEAVHNELIRDKRFVLIGRGIYALSEWGYKPGTVADVIIELLKKEGGPIKTDEIVDEVMKKRKVKINTVLLNLQNKKLFRRVARSTYTLNEH